MALLFDTLFETFEEGQEARQKKVLKGKIQASRASKRLDTTTLLLFNVAQLALQRPVPEILKRPPSEPIRLGSDVTVFGTESLACHYLGIHYKIAFVTEKCSVKDTLRIDIESNVTHKKPHGYLF